MAMLTPPGSSDSSAPGSPVTQRAISGVPRAEFYPRPNSHPFQTRTLLFSGTDQQIKVGRSVARFKPAPNNGIFDCKVLSRNHALMWYENGKFFLQDTKSSNGTFINNQRLSKGSEESPPREVCSGDILQFGVDVVENSRKVTHGCIIATVKLYLPDGKEAKASPTIVSSVSGTSLPPQDLYQLNHYLQEALAREQLLENKLAVLQRLVGQTESATSEAWKSLLDEDRLLTRVEILESQLSTYVKGISEDKLREEILRLIDEKEEYQKISKEAIRRIWDEKREAEKRLSEVERVLSNSEDEYSSLKELYESEVEENKRLAEELSKLASELEERQSKEETTNNGESHPEDTSQLTEENPDVTNSGDKSESALEAGLENQEIFEEMSELKNRLNILSQELCDARQSYEEASKMSLSFRDELQLTKDRLKETLDMLKAKERVIADLESRQFESEKQSTRVENMSEQTFETLTVAENEAYEELKLQISELNTLREENERLRCKLDKCSTDAGRVAQLELDLISAETKIDDLLKVKEKFAEVSEEKLNLTLSVNELKDQVEALTFPSRMTTCLAVIPLFMLCLAVIVAFMPKFSTLFATAEGPVHSGPV